MAERTIRLGVAGLGRAFTLMLPTFVGDSRIELVAATDLRAEARGRFETDFRARTYNSIDELCRDPAVEAIYIATPHQLHARHVAIAASHGKHALVEKPMAITLNECQAMIDAAQKAGIWLVIGHSHSFNAPILHARALIDSGDYGRVRMIHAMNYTDYMMRPRRPEELDTAQGGGVLFSQAAHQIDIVRLLGGGLARSVRAAAGHWDDTRPTEGAYSAFMMFDGGLFASLAYSGYAHFDSDEFLDWIGEMGTPKDRSRYGAARRALRIALVAGNEPAMKAARNYGGEDYVPAANIDATRYHQHFGTIIVSCDRADLRPVAEGVMIYGDDEARLDPVPVPAVPRAEVINEFYDAVVHDKPPLHDGAWSMATLEVCLAILQSSRTHSEIALTHQADLARTRGEVLT